MINDQFTIGALAKASNVNVETIRYYQRIGLLPTPMRDYGRIRRYTGENLKQMRFIRRAQHLGFSLDEIRLLLGLADDKHCTETRELAEAKLAIVEEKMADLAAIQETLKALITSCTTTTGGRGCPIIDSLEEDEPPQSAY
ncbi:hypothetical protein CAP31_04255 [Sulfuriferula sp. AH1]|uniref:MerR family transcriptional regulator n=1 Tax=Sulfuriferula sp. AH1 TaxID=1985873 RepID=UPI000B3B9E91|nr:MerR family DNA-binding protein [Sulfuriferula sp. AH1]ARU30971.1 hypothetical protein CAP31_04255 [Sulfuriferula sp. AH1]